MPNLYAWPLRTKYRTVQEIKYAVDRFAGDLKRFPKIMNMNLPQFFDFVKKIPYQRDVPQREIVSRPLYLLTVFPSLDCKKKSILMACFIALKYGADSVRFVLSSNRPDKQIGHVFTQFYNGKDWINADATYPQNILGQKKRVTNYEIVRR
jgi:hypothetical protein